MSSEVTVSDAPSTTPTFRSLLWESSSHGLLLASAASGQMLETNPAAARLLGARLATVGTLDQLSDACGLVVEGSDTRYPSARLPWSVARGGSSYSVDDIARRDGSAVTLLRVRADPISYQGGAVILISVEPRSSSGAQHLDEVTLEQVRATAHRSANLFGAIGTFIAIAAESLPPDGDAAQDLQQALEALEEAVAINRSLGKEVRFGSAPAEKVSLDDACTRLRSALALNAGRSITMHREAPAPSCTVTAPAGLVDAVLLAFALVVNGDGCVAGDLSIALNQVSMVEPQPVADVTVPAGDWAVVEARCCDASGEPVPPTSARSLAQLFRLADQLGAKVVIDGARGETSRWRLWLPQDVRQVSDEDEGADAPRVLVVDDERCVRHATVRALGSLDLEVCVCASAKEALGLLDDGQSVDLLLTDVVLPEMNGVQLAQRVRAKHPRVKVAFMSGFPGDVPIAKSAMRSGELFLTKPVTPARLRSAIGELIGDEVRG